MNRYFDDAWYHAKRTGQNLSMGVRWELEPAVRRAERLAGREPPARRTRMAGMREEMRRMELLAGETARRTAERARLRMGAR